MMKGGEGDGFKTVDPVDRPVDTRTHVRQCLENGNFDAIPGSILGDLINGVSKIYRKLTEEEIPLAEAALERLELAGELADASLEQDQDNN